MANKIIETQGGECTVIDAMKFNYICCGKKDGILDLPEVANCKCILSSNTLIQQAGTAMIEGIRINVEQKTFTFSAYPNTKTKYALIFSVTANSGTNETTFSSNIQADSTPLQQSHSVLYGVPGNKFQIKICTFDIDTDGTLSNLQDVRPLI